MFYTSILLRHIKTLQKNLIKMIESNTLNTDDYTNIKNEIISIKNIVFWPLQLLTITAAISVITFMFTLWWSTYKNLTSLEMIIYYLFNIPYFLKGYRCHRYYHYHYHYYYRDLLFLLCPILSSIDQY